MLKLIVTLVLLFIVGRMVWRFMYAIFEGAGMLKEPQDRERKAVKLVRDPVCGVFVETDDRTGLAVRVEPIRVGGRLKESIPEV